MVDGEAGKGDTYRKVDRKKWDESPIWEAMKNWSIDDEKDEDLENE